MSTTIYVKAADDGTYWVITGLLRECKERHLTAHTLKEAKQMVCDILDEDLQGDKSEILEAAEALAREIEEKYREK